MSKDCQDNGVVFGNWKLVPVDSHNWELCHRHAVSDTPTARKAGTVGVVQWNRLGRYYQYNTFALAIQYAADCELKDKAYGKQMELMDALYEYERILADFTKEVRQCNH